MTQTALYEQKAIRLKKQMLATNDRVAKLKKRAEKLQMKKQQEQIYLAEKREKELERDRQLAAKPSKGLMEQEKEKGKDTKDKEKDPKDKEKEKDIKEKDKDTK
jgi:hypothetical protein